MKAVIFDFNGTLFFDTQYHIDTWKKYIRQALGRELSDEEFMRRIFGRDNNAIIKDIFDTDDMERILEISEEKELWYRNLCESLDVSLVKGAERFFDELKKRGILFTIATGANKSNVDFYFKIFHLDQWFDYDKVVYDDGHLPGKPDPTVYRLACEKLGVDPTDCLVIEDSPAGVISAYRAGIGQVYVMMEKDRAFSENVDGFIHDFDELIEKI